MTLLDENPQSLAVFFSATALVVEIFTLAVLLLGKWSSFAKRFNFPEFTLPWKNQLLLCLIGQIICVEVFHAVNIWQYTTPPDAVERCKYSSKLVVFFYVFQCFFLYLFLMVKVQTTMLHPTKVVRLLDLFLKALTFGVIPVLMVLVFFLFNGIYIPVGGRNVCVMTTNPIWAIILVGLDIILNGGFLFLFVLPIMQILEVDEQLKGSPTRSAEDVRRRNMMMSVARRNLIVTCVCVVISVTALAAMIYEAYSDSVVGRVFGCFPCVVASIANTFLMLITTKGAWKTRTEPKVPKDPQTPKRPSGFDSDTPKRPSGFVSSRFGSSAGASGFGTLNIAPAASQETTEAVGKHVEL
eukprot:TRINITY_DN70505_c0_g1_i1.p1 TRINITY_DN70505_c0_g1~~TRINITY_DN70505_c0_g1_i1.p1  ORF type:complete len:354 (-),score=83.63 TRINITY_DN70505_c0_g1_i1:65-1126(-)